MVEEKYKRTAREFFGGKRCVYRHEIQEQATEWHHLDEKRDPEFEKRFENIVPLNGADHNLLTYDPRLYRGSVDGGGLSWRGLLFVGGEKFAKGRFADSYGCSRLAASIVDPRRSETHHGFVGNAGHSVEACGWALSSLKQYSSNPHSLPLVKDVLDRDVLPTLANPNLVHGVPNAAIALVATEIQGLYRDYGLINDARRWAELSHSVAFVGMNKHASRSSMGDRIIQRVVQQRAFTALTARDPEGEKLLDEALDVISEAHPRSTATFWGRVLSVEETARSLLTAVDDFQSETGAPLPTEAFSEPQSGTRMRHTYGTGMEAILAKADGLWLDGRRHDAFELVEVVLEVMKRIGLTNNLMRRSVSLRSFLEEARESPRERTFQRSPSDLDSLVGSTKTLERVVCELIRVRA